MSTPEDTRRDEILKQDWAELLKFFGYVRGDSTTWLDLADCARALKTSNPAIIELARERIKLLQIKLKLLGMQDDPILRYRLNRLSEIIGTRSHGSRPRTTP